MTTYQGGGTPNNDKIQNTKVQHCEKVLLQEQNPSGRGGVEWVPPPIDRDHREAGLSGYPPPIIGVEWVPTPINQNRWG